MNTPASGRSRLSEAFAADAVRAPHDRAAFERDLSSLLIRASTDGVIGYDREFRYTEWNPAVERMTGVPREQVIGQVAFELFPFLVSSGAAEQLQRVLDGETVQNGPTPFRIPSTGYAGVYESSHTPLRDAAGEIVGGLCIVRDVTERHRMEQALRTATIRAEAVSQVKSAYVANLSHELRTPLNGILGFAEMLHDGKAGPIPAPQRELLADIIASGRHLLHIVTDVLDMAKIEAGMEEVAPAPMELAAAVDEVCTTVRLLAEARRVRLVANVDPQASAIVGDPARVRQVLYNLVTNAVKFVAEGGLVHVSGTRIADDTVRITVRDSGPGIAAADLPRLFTPFERLRRDRGTDAGGTGLGLAYTKRLVELQGGRISVESTPADGSTFTVLLPRTLGA